MNGVFIHLAAYIVFLSTHELYITGVVMSFPEPFSKARNNILSWGSKYCVCASKHTVN